MHGRLKVKTTEEQAAEKRKEREKKAVIFRELLANVFEKRQKNELDEELLNLTEKLLSSVPDIYTLWNLRKEIFLVFVKTRDLDEVENLFKSELGFLQKCLHVNPKSYGVWHHRQFVMETMTNPDWMEELRLCSVFLSYDSRNFHCWDYRRFVASNAVVSDMDELQYTMKKIEENFSNYSAWHYRSKLLPKCNWLSETSRDRMSEEALLKEMDIVQNAFFTDPNDQSAWFYERWLLGRESSSERVIALTASRDNAKLYLQLSLSRSLKLHDASGKVTYDGTIVKGLWKSSRASKASHVWMFDGALTSPYDDSMAVNVFLQDCNATCSVQFDKGQAKISSNYFVNQRDLLFRDVHSETKSSVLLSQLESLELLLEEEPDNKWTLFTMVHLMKAIDHMKYKKQIDGMMAKLADADPYRQAFYSDLHSKLKIEHEIERLCLAKDSFEAIDLRNRDLTCLRHMQYFLSCKQLDIAENHLSSLEGLDRLQNIEEINANNNDLDEIEEIGSLWKLTKLYLRDNHISSLDNLNVLKHCKSLTSLDLRGNPVTDTTTFSDAIKEIVPSLVELNGQHL